jgi:hypothetical protein
MNKKGQITILYGFMLGLTILILALALAPSVKQFTDSARNESSGDTTGMNCSTTTDSFIKTSCYATDLQLFLFIGFLIFLSGSIIAAKFFFGGE